MIRVSVQMRNILGSKKPRVQVAHLEVLQQMGAWGHRKETHTEGEVRGYSLGRNPMYLLEIPRVRVNPTFYIILLFGADFCIDGMRLQYHLICQESQAATEHACGCSQLCIEIGAGYRLLQLGSFLTF